MSISTFNLHLFLVVFGPFIGRVARYTPSSRSKTPQKQRQILNFIKVMQSRRITKQMQQKSHQQDTYALPAISSCKERGFSERDHPIRRTSPFTCEVMHLHFAHNVSISSPSPSPSTVKGESRNNEIRHKYARTRAMENPCHFQNERILPLYGYCPWMERLSAG